LALPAALPIEVVRAGTVMTRIHWSETTEPFFGPKPRTPPTHRFHDPRGEFRVCFLVESASASFAETFLRNPPVRIVTRVELERRHLTTVRLRYDVRLVQLHSEGLARTGCTADISSSTPPYTEPQRLSRELWAHPDRPDGIQYCCRHDNGLLAIALYHRAAGALDVFETEALVADRPRLLAWRKRYGFEIA